MSVLHSVLSPDRNYKWKDKLNSLTGHLDCRFLEWSGWYNQDILQLSGVSRPTINLGRKELNGESEVVDSLRIRKDGCGRKKATEKQKGLEKELESMMEPGTRGDPQSVLRWTCVGTLNCQLR
ncbi:MAG: hypothetical protein ABI760_25510 [Ferruginibacter sp.]